jgi:hypothetical protein
MIPEFAYRDALPMAKLEASVRNLAGGKPEGDSDKTIAVDRLWTPEECLPRYAWTDDVMRVLQKKFGSSDFAGVSEPIEWMTGAGAEGLLEAAECGLIPDDVWMQMLPLWGKVCATQKVKNLRL